jgi:RNA polymerase sigma factor (sigma-70 family)
MVNRVGSCYAEICSVAEQSLVRYARGIITADDLARQIEREWDKMCRGDDHPPHALLVRIAQRICSRELYAAWRSSDEYLCNCAFANLRKYLECSLLHCGYASALLPYENSAEDVLHQTLEELHRLLQKSAGPDDPAAFLKWAQTILIRHAYAHLHKCRQNPCLSLDAHIEVYVEQCATSDDSDPYTYVEASELHQTLKDAILSLRNLRYQQVLLHTYLDGMDEVELASRLQVPVQDVYMWRCRALKQLRSNTELMQRLHSLRR